MMNKLSKLIFLYLFLSLTASIVSISVARAAGPLEGEVEFPEGYYFVEVDDLVVKVMGGYVTARRTWYKKQWHFNRLWAPLVFNPNIDPRIQDAPLVEIERNGDVYSLDQEGGRFIYDEQKVIRIVPGGYRWQDREGNWIEYDSLGLIARYGDRNDVEVSFQHDPQGRLTGVFDHFGTQVLWFEYGLGDNRITAVRDSTTPVPRRVEYRYVPDAVVDFFDRNQPIEVTDAVGKIWKYGYTGVTAPNSQGLTTITDPDNRVVTISYYDNGRTRSIKRADGSGPAYSYDFDSTSKEYYVKESHPSGRLEEFWYDEEGDLFKKDFNGRTIYTLEKGNFTRGTISRTGEIKAYFSRRRISEDENGNVTTRQYDQWNNLTEIVNPDRSRVYFEYDPEFSQITRETNELGITTTYDYDLSGNLIRKIEALGTPDERTTEYSYDAYGNRLQHRILADPNTPEALTVYTYDSFGNVDTVTDPEQNLTDFLVYDTMGNPLQWRDGRNKLWQRSYDELGRLLSEIDPLNNETVYQYDGAGNRTQVTDAELNITEFQYDTNNRRVAIIDALTNRRSFSYNAAGQLEVITDEEKRTAFFAYDSSGRLSRITDGVGNVIKRYYGEAGSGASHKQISRIEYPTYSEHFSYDQRGRRVSMTQRTADNGDFVTFYDHDLAGNRVLITDPEQRNTRFVYDALNRLRSVFNPLNDQVTFTLDDRSNILNVTNERNIVIRSFSFDRNNRKRTETWPTGESWSYDYDEMGNLTRTEDAKGQVTRLLYDDAGRNIRIEYYPDTLATAPQKTVIFGHDKLGNVTSFDDGTISGIVGYDELLRLTGETINFGPFSKSYQYGYFDNGSKRSFTAPDSSVTEFGYDLANQLSTVKLPTGTGTIVYTDYLWTQPGQVIYPGGTLRKLAYDDLQRVTDIDVTDPAGNPLLDYQYGYDRVGNIEDKITEHGAYAYGYDDLNRLTSAINPTLLDEVYDYDPAGNRIQSNDVAGLWIYNDSNQLQSYGLNSFGYDANGNTVLRTDTQGSIAYEYNLENRLTRVRNATSNTEIASYHYDPFGRRIWKDVGGVRTYFMYAQEGLIAEYDALGNEIRSYVHEPGAMWGTAPLYLRENSNSGFYQLDHLGTPIKVVAAAGNVLWAGEAGAFGEMTERVSGITNPLRFPGQYFDQETGTHYNYFRDYDPTIGRYIQSDPIGLDGGLNTYSYVGSNPVSFIDSFGLHHHPAHTTPCANGDFDCAGGIPGPVSDETTVCGLITPTCLLPNPVDFACSFILMTLCEKGMAAPGCPAAIDPTVP